MPRFRFTVRWLMVAVAIAGMEFAYARFVIWACADWGPEVVFEQFQGASRATVEAWENYARSERTKLMALLIAIPILLVNLSLIALAVLGLRRSRRL